jgi:hypothetical protein
MSGDPASRHDPAEQAMAGRPGRRGSRRSGPALAVSGAIVAYGYIRGLLSGLKKDRRAKTGDTGSAEHLPPEEPGVAPRPVLMIAFGFMAFVGISITVLYFYFESYVPGPIIRPVSTFPAPPLRFSTNDLAALRAEQRQALSGYDWIDGNRQIAKIPIDRAMQIIADRGARALEPFDVSPDSSVSQNPGGGQP